MVGGGSPAGAEGDSDSTEIGEEVLYFPPIPDSFD